MLTGDWSEYGTADALEKEIGHKFRPGWTETETDTALMVEIPTTGTTPLYRLNVWNRPGVRAELSALLGLPVHEEKPTPLDMKGL